MILDVRNKMKSVASLIVLSMMAVSCINLEGNLSVNQSMSVRTKGGFLNLKNKTIKLEAGNYRADLKVKSEKNFMLKVSSDRYDELNIPIKAKKDFSIPDNGPITISGSDINQPFDLAGNVATNVSNSDIIKANESCTYERTERRCEKICTPIRNEGPVRGQEPGRNGERHDRDGDGRNENCRIECRDVIITLNGNRYVEYHTRTVEKSLAAKLLSTNSKSELATFSGKDFSSERINDYIGECR